MNARPLPDLAYLRECFDYDVETGALTWRERPRSHFASDGHADRWNRDHARAAAGCQHSTGHRRVCIAWRRYLVHRIAYAIGTGELPAENLDIDHVNGNRSDNRLANLRLATRRQNLQNRPGCQNNNQTAGFIGVCRMGPYWRVQMRSMGQRLHDEIFRTRDEAIAARIAAEREHYGDFAPRREPVDPRLFDRSWQQRENAA